MKRSEIIPLYPPFTTNPPFAEGFVVNDVGDEDLNPRKRGFDYKRKVDGSMPVGFADERSE